MARPKKNLSEIIVVMLIIGLIGVCWAVYRHLNPGKREVEFNYQDF